MGAGQGDGGLERQGKGMGQRDKALGPGCGVRGQWLRCCARDGAKEHVSSTQEGFQWFLAVVTAGSKPETGWGLPGVIAKQAPGNVPPPAAFLCGTRAT